MAIVLSSREDSVAEANTATSFGSPSLVAFVVGDVKATPDNNTANQQQDERKVAGAAELDNTTSGSNRLDGAQGNGAKDGGEEDTVDCSANDTYIVNGEPPQKRRRGRRVSKALRGLAHGLLLRKRSSDEKKEAEAALTSKVFEFDR